MSLVKGVGDDGERGMLTVMLRSRCVDREAREWRQIYKVSRHDELQSWRLCSHTPLCATPSSPSNSSSTSPSTAQSE